MHWDGNRPLCWGECIAGFSDSHTYGGGKGYEAGYNELSMLVFPYS